MKNMNSNNEASQNSGSIARSQDAIVAELERIRDEDVFGFKSSVLINYLEYERVKPYLRTVPTKDKWYQYPLDREFTLGLMRDYMPFAWKKANDGRGLSAGRSLAYFSAYIWILGDESIFGDLETYSDYGKAHLQRICNHYGFKAL